MIFNKNIRGFTLIEMIVAMAFFVIIIGISGEAFNTVAKNVSQQFKISESDIQGMVGLEIMRHDLATAGYGLPWSYSNAIIYSEVDSAVSAQELIASGLNDAPSGIPKSITGFNNYSSNDNNVVIKGSDYLVVRSQSTALTQAARKWTYINSSTASVPAGGYIPKVWGSSSADLNVNNRVIVLRDDYSNKLFNQLVMDGTDFFTTFTSPFNAAFGPGVAYTNHYIYGVDDNTDLRMPFNRADFYVRIPVGTEFNKLPKRCATNTGILYKAIVSQNGGNLSNEYPLLDCIADMQVLYYLDVANDNNVTYTDSISALTAEEIRNQLKRIQVFILTHEGKKERTYSYPNSSILVGQGTGTGRVFDLTKIVDYSQYRWKVITFSIQPRNMNLRPSTKE